MRYFVLFCMVVAFTAGLAIWCIRKMGEAATVAIGTLLTVALIVLFVLNKSDSVADTILEKIADVSPPLVTGSIVLGWWLGYALHKMWTRANR